MSKKTLKELMNPKACRARPEEPIADDVRAQQVEARLAASARLERAYGETGLKEIMEELRKSGRFAIGDGVLRLPQAVYPSERHDENGFKKSPFDYYKVVMITPRRGHETGSTNRRYDRLIEQRASLDSLDINAHMALRINSHGEIDIGRFDLTDAQVVWAAASADSSGPRRFTFLVDEISGPFDAVGVAEYIGNKYPEQAVRVCPESARAIGDSHRLG